MKYCAVLLLGVLAASAAHAQDLRNSITISAVGNFNPASRVYINGDQQMISSNRSAMGGSVEYRRWMTPRNAFGFEYEQNPSDGKLVYFSQPGVIGESIWPQMRYEALALFTQEVSASLRFSIFTQEGAGTNFTNGYSNSGWSHDVAFAEGAGGVYTLSRHTAIEVGALCIDAESGCYNGRACKQTWGVVVDTRIGLRFGW